ncbi:oligoribonuclease NrnB/cAMP/cGMP phosphodiesterase (DHH superfamily) [Bradyrhizobium japonicum]|uniref:DHHA1 domain-containing protein n=1 Tax=Bradyrhizobium TaxID=374 RepID=UPI0004B7021C|nr:MULTISPECIES: DHHA1 domain-containing protein [Bradyrhizobium]MDI2076994.1 DHHA1 domain-containing protein [Bradyrhizobium sp. Mp27]
MTPDLCIYHGACDDGFGAAFALWKRDGAGPDYLPGVYGEAPPDVTGLDVAIVDFSYKRPVMIELAAKARSILVLDHHKTAQAELDGLSAECPNVEVHFDMERSGAVMAWEYFHPGEPVPLLFHYLQDRDLWRKQLPGVDSLTMALRSYPQKFNVWDQLEVQTLITEGEAIHRYYRTLIDSAKKHHFMREIGGYTVPVVNGSLFMSSEVAGELAEGHPFAAMYAETEKGVIWSLRSRNDGVDVSEVAKRYGGGGHKNAAGFTVPRP